jgi:hypothetical protein
MPVKPSDAEEEYFRRLELERRKTAELDTSKLVAEAERRRERDLHFMKCPKCGRDLVEIDYRELKVDKCTGCEGVWLDPGELEAVTRVERSTFERVFGTFRRRD